MTDKTGIHLLTQDLAVEDYLGHLLTSPEKLDAPKPCVDMTNKSVVYPFPARRVLDDPRIPTPETESAPAVPVELKEAECTAPVDESSEIVPDWGRLTFDCSTVTIEGIPFLFPDQFIVSVVDGSTALRPVKNQPDWVLGLAMLDKGFTAVLDSKQLFFQDSAQPEAGADHSSNRQILVFGDGRWALACERVESGQLVQTSDVRWRTDDRQRIWLAGMLKRPATPLINPERLFEIMQRLS